MGNAGTLSHDANWAALIEHARARGALVGAPPPPRDASGDAVAQIVDGFRGLLGHRGLVSGLLGLLADEDRSGPDAGSAGGMRGAEEPGEVPFWERRD